MATTLTEANQEYVPTAWETVPCLFCGNADAFVLEKFGPEQRYKYVRCTSCGLAYLNPRPRYDKEFVSTAYDVYASSVADVWKNGRLTEEGERRAVRIRSSLSEMESFLGRKGRMLEIGCHTGFFCKVARDAGWDVTGVDISPTMIELARKEFGLNVLCGNWLEMDLNGPYDLVYCSHTIEHVPNPTDWLNKFSSVLAKNGRLCLEVPNMESIDRKFKRVLKRAGLKRDRWEPWRTPDHLYEPCEKSFVPYLERNGFHVVYTCTYSRNKPSAGVLGRLYHNHFKIGSNLRLYLEKKH